MHLLIRTTGARGPGKRQIKPTAAVLDYLPNAEDEEDDEDFVAENENGSNEGSGSDDSDSDGSEDTSSSTSSDVEDEEKEKNAASMEELSGDVQDQPRICALCLNLSSIAQSEEVMQCDKCGLAVHDSCYMSLDVSEDNDSTQSSSSTEPWFCEPCVYGFNEPPHCELCPSRYGAMKRSDVGGRWVHLICALYTRGVTFGDIDHLTAISWQEMDHRNFGRKSCSGCTDVLEARFGVTTRCELGLCKQHYHATCAQSAARFLAQEEKRLAMVGKKVLSEREERKRLRARQKYEKQFQSLVGVTICLPEAFHDKIEMKMRRARHLTTSPEFFEWFQEKAEISGVEPEQFKKEFTRVSGDSIPFLTPGFSPQFFEYLAHREQVVFAAEEQKLKSINDSKVTLKKQLDTHMTKLKLTEQSGQMGRQRSECRKKLALAFHDVLMKLGAKKLPPIVKIFGDTSEDGNISRRRNSLTGNTPAVSLASLKKLKKEMSINVCKECRKTKDQHLMIGCDSCHEFYHIGCLDPPLEKVPKKVNCEWHCADCCENSDEEDHEDNGEGSTDGAVTRRLRQRNESAKVRRLAAAEEENRAYRAAILGNSRTSTPKKTPDKKHSKRASLDPPTRSPADTKRHKLELPNGQKTNGLSSSGHTTYLPEGEELGEDCFVILDDEE
ncbi:PHD-finger [Oesophagostomum dentatum]|uniref:PHD-finger n=1 Tax=Oesophagostomum dentatum TaxID=61180 RepID=A0A0B1TCH2_OESDE|nr:PHD-finger [Oesophagostomum dentatum]